jgi:hypothetical protein
MDLIYTFIMWLYKELTNLELNPSIGNLLSRVLAMSNYVRRQLWQLVRNLLVKHLRNSCITEKGIEQTKIVFQHKTLNQRTTTNNLKVVCARWFNVLPLTPTYSNSCCTMRKITYSRTFMTYIHCLAFVSTT